MKEFLWSDNKSPKHYEETNTDLSSEPSVVPHLLLQRQIGSYRDCDGCHGDHIKNDVCDDRMHIWYAFVAHEVDEEVEENLYPLQDTLKLDVEQVIVAEVNPFTDLVGHGPSDEQGNGYEQWAEEAFEDTNDRQVCVEIISLLRQFLNIARRDFSGIICD